MRRIIDFEALCDWARERCGRSHLNIWIGTDKETNDIMLIVQGQYAIMPADSWLHDVQWMFEETIKLAEEKAR